MSILNDAGFIYNHGVFKTASLENVNISTLTVDGGSLVSMGNVENGHNGTGRNNINLHNGTIRVNGNLINGAESNTAPHGTIIQDGGRFEVSQSVFALHSGNYTNVATSNNIFHIDGGKFILTGTPVSPLDSLVIHREIIVSKSGQFIIDQNRVVHC